jgi:hypothetical protein
VTYGQSTQMSRIVGQLLKFSKFGDWSAGETGEVIEHGTELIADMPELMVGWQRWADGKPTDQVMGRIADGYQAPRRSELGDTDREQWEIDDQGKERDPWQFSNMLILKAVDSDQIYTFATSSRGGLQAIGRLSIEYGNAMRHKPDQLPVVRLGRDSYDHPNKTYGEIRVPIMELVGWVPREEVDAVLEPTRSPSGDAAKKAIETQKPKTTGKVETGGTATTQNAKAQNAKADRATRF